MRAQAQQAFEACAAKAKELEVYAPFVAGCASKSAVSEPAPAMSVARPQASSPAITREPAGVEVGTGRREPRVGSASRSSPRGTCGARGSTLQRAIELEDVRATRHAALGVALARLGEFESARRTYKHALELDPTLDRAHAGLAALRCHFGDSRGARPS